MRARRGITLFEAVVGIAIVALTAVSALAAAGAEMRTADRARRALVVEALATERHAFLTLMSDRELLNLPDSVAEGRFEYPFEEYQWTTTSEPNSDYAGLYDIRVTVTWPSGQDVESFTTSSSEYRSPPVVTRR